MTAPARSSAFRTALETLASVDWARTLHKLAVFARTLRGDPDAAEDAERAQRAAQKTRETIETIGRKAAGCVAPAFPCTCAWCQEQRS